MLNHFGLDGLEYIDRRETFRYITTKQSNEADIPRGPTEMTARSTQAEDTSRKAETFPEDEVDTLLLQRSAHTAAASLPAAIRSVAPPNKAADQRAAPAIFR